MWGQDMSERRDGMTKLIDEDIIDFLETGLKILSPPCVIEVRRGYRQMLIFTRENNDSPIRIWQLSCGDGLRELHL